MKAEAVKIVTEDGRPVWSNNRGEYGVGKPPQHCNACHQIVKVDASEKSLARAERKLGIKCRFEPDGMVEFFYL